MAPPTSLPLPLNFPNTPTSGVGPLLAPPSVSPPSYTGTPMSATRPSPPLFSGSVIAPPLTPPMIPATPFSAYHLHMSFLNEARRNHGLLMPTPKYPHEFSPASVMASELPLNHRQTPVQEDKKSPLAFQPPPGIPAPTPMTLLRMMDSTSNSGSPASSSDEKPSLAPPQPPPQEAAQAPPSMKQVTDGISELAARILFMNVKWTQNIPAFTSLPYRDQMLLLEESWRELFVLNSAQFALPVELAAQTLASAENESLLSELKNLQDAIQKFQAMNVDTTEYACLRAIILLKTHIESNGEDQKELRDQAAINSLQDQAQLTLSKYISNAYPTQPSRFGKLLLLLPSLKSISGKAIEELFFKKTIGAIPIEKIICDMYKGAGAVASAIL